MNLKDYIVQYSPPILIKDQPHRILDTAEQSISEIGIDSDDQGSVSIVGLGIQVGSQDLKSEECKSENTVIPS